MRMLCCMLGDSPEIPICWRTARLLAPESNHHIARCRPAFTRQRKLAIAATTKEVVDNHHVSTLAINRQRGPIRLVVRCAADRAISDAHDGTSLQRDAAHARAQDLDRSEE